MFEFLQMGRQVDTDITREAPPSTRPGSRSAGTIRGTTIRSSSRWWAATIRGAITRPVRRARLRALVLADRVGAWWIRQLARQPFCSRYPRDGWADFRFSRAPGDFSRGGSEGDEISVKQSSAAFRLTTSHVARRYPVDAGRRGRCSIERPAIRSAGVDSAANVPSAGAPDTARRAAAGDVVWQRRARTRSSAKPVLRSRMVRRSRRAVRNAWVSMAPVRARRSFCRRFVARSTSWARQALG